MRRKPTGIILFCLQYIHVVPPPLIEFVSQVSPINNEPYTASCVASFTGAVPMSLVTIEWMDANGNPITEIDGNRITESSIRQIDDRTYARDVSVNPLRIEDSGTYTCEAAVMGDFITSQPASESFEFVVFGKYVCMYVTTNIVYLLEIEHFFLFTLAQAELAIDQDIVPVVLNSSQSTGGDVTFVCSVFGSPFHPNATWQYIGPGGSDPVPLPDGIQPVENEISETNLTSAITIQAVRFMDRGTYRCTGMGLSDDVRLVVAGKK